MKKRILIRLALLAVLAAPGFLLLVWWASRSAVSLEVFSTITGKMTEADIRTTLGAPEPNEHNFVPSRDCFNVRVVTFAEGEAVSYKHWIGDGQVICVSFGENGRVQEAIYFRVKQTALDKIRRWIRL